MKRIAATSVLIAALAVIVTPVLAQAPGFPGAPVPGAGPGLEEPREKEVEGTVSKVDPTAKTLQVSWGLFGLLGSTLQVTDETQVRIEGRQDSLAGIREGAKVKASYETREGKNIARSIEVMPAAEQESGAERRPAPPAGLPAGAAPMPPAAQPKTQ
jgi:Cu/Ag efflux protein CusF